MSTDNQNPAEVRVSAMQQYLLAIGFQQIAQIGHSLAFRHPKSGSMVTLTIGEASGLVRPADFLSIKFRLEAEGLISEDAIAELGQGRLPIAS